MQVCLSLRLSMLISQIVHISSGNCNILTYVSSINTWASEDFPLAQLVKELDLCLFLRVIGPFSNLSL